VTVAIFNGPAGDPASQFGATSKITVNHWRLSPMDALAVLRLLDDAPRPFLFHIIHVLCFVRLYVDRKSDCVWRFELFRHVVALSARSSRRDFYEVLRFSFFFLLHSAGMSFSFFEFSRSMCVVCTSTHTAPCALLVRQIAF
jgi:hypothetical protein